MIHKNQWNTYKIKWLHLCNAEVGTERMTMTKNKRVLQALKQLIGKEKYYEVAEVFAGQNVYFPYCQDRQERNEKIKFLYESGVSSNDLSDMYELSKSQIYKIIEKV